MYCCVGKDKKFKLGKKWVVDILPRGKRETGVEWRWVRREAITKGFLILIKANHLVVACLEFMGS